MSPYLPCPLISPLSPPIARRLVHVRRGTANLVNADAVAFNEGECSEMAIRKEDWPAINQAIDGAIKKAIDPLTPHGWRRLLLVIRELGTVAAVLSVQVALLAVTFGALYQSFSHVEKETEFRTSTGDTLKDVDEHLKKIDAELSANSLEKIAANPIDKESANAAKKLIVDAKAASTQLPTNVIEQVGQKFIAAAEKEPAAWDTAVAFLDYKSFINSSLPIPDTGIRKAVTHYQVNSPSGTQPPSFRVAGAAPPESAAELQAIGINKNANLPVGDAYIIANGGAVALDGLEFRNVILQNVHVYYYGGPVQMTNVYFLNCTFEMRQGQNTQKLALAALTGALSITFSAG
jgi:hypothetical protein